MLKRLGESLLRYRLAALLTILGLTAFFSYEIQHVWMESPTIDLFPSNHPYVQTFIKYSKVFSGASRVVIQIEVKQGDIFTRETLAKVVRITKRVELLPGINNYQVLSLSQRKLKERMSDSERGFSSRPFMPEVPKTIETMEALKRRVYTNNMVYGSLVSLDSKATLIVAGFFDKKINPKTIYKEISEIVAGEEDEHTSIHVIGRPIAVGYILARYPELLKLFLATLVSTILVLSVYFRDPRGVIVPLLTATISAIWGLGFMGLMRINFDPLVIVVPFIISARALSHSVQLIERFYEEYSTSRDRIMAAIATFDGLFQPGIIGIVTDVLGVALVWLTPIPLMQKLGLTGGFWIASIIISDLIFNPVLLSYLPPPRLNTKAKKRPLDHFMMAIARLNIGRWRNLVFGATGVLAIVGFIFARSLVIGDVNPGTPMLWPDSKYNLDTARISSKFRNADELTVVVEGTTREAIKDPNVLRTMEAFQRHMEAIPEVGAASSIADFFPGQISFYYGRDPKWELIPNDPRESGFFMEMLFQSSEPGDLVRFTTINNQNANITINLLDHKGETLRKVIAHAKEFIKTNRLPGAEFRLAGGMGGLLAALNELVAYYEFRITFLAFLSVFIICAWSYRSFLAGVLFLTPLVLSNFTCYALMGARGIGMDVNSLPVVSIGVGLGVDYGLYVVERIKQEFARTGDVDGSITTAICTAGKAVLFTAITMVSGVAFWGFSFLKFQADMGILLVFWMVMAMLGGLILLPALVHLIRPKFVFSITRSQTP
ncbi:MAG: MMPL family transporter [Deltaproteobacteria bacterium]|nr:MMPL family transporter [Deltaproteobacteria bacterium]